MGAGKTVIVLISAGNGCIQPFGQGLALRDGIADNNAGAGQDHRKAST